MQTPSFSKAVCTFVPAMILSIISTVSLAQNAYTPDVGNVGLPDNGVLHGTSIETVQLNNGNLHIDIPLLHLPGIGMDTDIHLTYDSQGWNYTNGYTSTNSSTPFSLVTQTRPPWQTKDPMAGYLKWGQHSLEWNCPLITGNPTTGSGSNTVIDYMSFSDGDGTAHTLPVQGLLPSGTAPDCGVNGSGGTWPTLDTTGDSNNGYYPVYSIDNSGYNLVVDGNGNAVKFLDKHGTQYTFATQSSSAASGLPAPLASTSNQCAGGSGCGATLNPGGATLAYYKQLTSMEDSDGNRISASYGSSSMTITDTVHRTVTETFFPSVTSAQPPVCHAIITQTEANEILPLMTESIGQMPSTIQYTDQAGTTQTITVCYGLAPVSLSIFCGTSTACGSEPGENTVSGYIVVPLSIHLQNGDIYSFQYQANGDPNYMGEITSITLPTGGTIGYTYSDYLTPTNSGRLLLSRTLTDPVNNLSSTWNYHYSPTTLNSVVTTSETVTVTDPNQNDTVYTCNNNPTNFTTVAWNAPCVMTKEVAYNGLAFSHSPIVTKSTGYSFVGSSLQPTSEIVSWNPNGPTTETDTTWDTFGTPGTQSFFVSTYGVYVNTLSRGLPKSKIMYNYGSSSHGSAISNTQYTYLHEQNTAYLAPNITDRVAQVTVYNSATASASTLVAQTNTAYDGFGQSGLNGQSGLKSTSGTTMHDYTHYSTSQTLRGLPTSVTKYSTTSGATVTSYTDYNDLGNPTVKTDADGNSTTYAYASGTGQNAFLASTTMPATNGNTHVLYETHDVNTGLLTQRKDLNGNPTNYTYDPVMRVLVTTRPDGGVTTNSYPLAGQLSGFDTQVVSNVTENGSTGTSITKTTNLDGLGRTISVSTTSDSVCQSLTVNTTYDLLGRVSTVTNPQCVTSNDTDGTTTYTYDAVGRLTNKQNPDGSVQQWSINANVVTFKDETLRQWQHTYDAADRLIKVLEPNPANGLTAAPTLETDYSYDALNNLVGVTQWGGPNGSSNSVVRSFAYDALSRLIAANNPESSGPSKPAAQTCAGAPSGTSWTSCYTYDSVGNLTQKTDNRGISINYAYDAMNRVTGKTYSDTTPSVAYTYDASSVSGASNTKGELTQATVSNGSTVLAQTVPYAYDKMGRLQMEQQCTPANCSATPYSMAYTFDLAGKTLQATIPSSANGVSGQALSLTYGYDGQDRLNQVVSSWSSAATYPATLFSATSNTSNSPAYGPVGLLNANFGLSTANPTYGVLALNRAYDSRGRVVSEVDSAVSGSGSAATDSTGTITIAGAEQSLTRTAVGGNATFTISGSDTETTQVCTYYYPCGASMMCTPTVTCNNVPVSGSIAFTVWKDEFTPFASAVSYGVQSDSSIATALATAVNTAGGPVTAVAAGTTVSVNATGTGPSTDYPFSISNTSATGLEVTDNGVPVTSMAGTLTGGVTANPSDTGTISVTISGNVTSIPFGPGSTPTNLATALAAAINAQDGGYVTATASGTKVSLTSVGDGSAQDWHLTESVTWDSADFSTASFTATDAGMSGGANSTNALYSYAIPAYGGYDKNGNLLTVTDTVMGKWTYAYDNLNRLVTASAPTSQPSGVNVYFAGIQSLWSYDNFGNRLSETQGAIAGATPQASMPTSSTATYNTSNQMISATQNGGSALVYDAAGNVTNDGLNSYLYDAEGRICAANTRSNLQSSDPAFLGYIYDAAGIRVAKGYMANFSCNFATNGFVTTTSWALGQGGEQVGEWKLVSGAWAWQHSNAYADGKVLGTYDQSGLHFYFNDWLGTRRIQTNALGQVELTCTSLSFGNGENCTASTLATAEDPTEQHFTGKERDTESGNDYFDARYYSSSLGRFMSPDWSAKEDPVPYAQLDDPQSLNLYTYVGNNPLARADADGHCFIICLAAAGGGAAALSGAEGGGEIGSIAGPIGTGVGILVGAGVGYLAYESMSNNAGPPASTGMYPTSMPIHLNSDATDRGRSNEGAGLAEVGATKNTTPSTTTDPKTGKAVTTIPDGKMADGQNVEVKDTKVVRSTPQLRGQGQASAAESGKKPILVTGTHTKVSKSVDAAKGGTHIVVRTPKLGPQQ